MSYSTIPRLLPRLPLRLSMKHNDVAPSNISTAFLHALHAPRLTLDVRARVYVFCTKNDTRAHASPTSDGRYDIFVRSHYWNVFVLTSSRVAIPGFLSAVSTLSLSFW